MNDDILNKHIFGGVVFELAVNLCICDPGHPIVPINANGMKVRLMRLFTSVSPCLL